MFYKCLLCVYCVFTVRLLCVYCVFTMYLHDFGCKASARACTREHNQSLGGRCQTGKAPQGVRVMCASASAKGCAHNTAHTQTRYQGSGFTHHSHIMATRDNFRHGHAATVQVILIHSPFTSLLPHPRPTPVSHASYDVTTA